MKIRTDYWQKPIPAAAYDWSAVDEDIYDGAPDSRTRGQMGYGASEQEAIDDLLEILGLGCEGWREHAL